jgi:hypothetical protein
MIIRFRHNKRTNAHDMKQRLQTQFGQEAYTLRTIQFWIGEVRRDREDSMMKTAWKGLLDLVTIREIEQEMTQCEGQICRRSEELRETKCTIEECFGRLIDIMKTLQGFAYEMTRLERKINEKVVNLSANAQQKLQRAMADKHRKRK